MNDFREELAELRADEMMPDAAVRARVSARLTHSIAAVGAGSTAPAQARWISPLKLGVSFVLGGALGAGLYGTVRAPRIERVYVDRPVRVVPPPSDSITAPTAPEELPALAVTSKPIAPAVSSLPDRAASLAEQQALLDLARSAFASGDYTQTLQTLATHAKRFPKSVLGEEREALQIKALAASGRLAEARRRAERFRVQFPQSLLLPSIRNSIESNP